MSGHVDKTSHSVRDNQREVDRYVDENKGKKGHDNDEKDIKDFGSDDSDLPPADENDNAGGHKLIDSLPKGLQNLLKKMGIDTDEEFKHGKSEEGYGKGPTDDTDGQGDKKPGGKNKGDKAPPADDQDGRPAEGESEHYGHENMGATVTMNKDGPDGSDFTVTLDKKNSEPQEFKNVPDGVSAKDLMKSAKKPLDSNGYAITDIKNEDDPSKPRHLVRDKDNNTQVIDGDVVSGDAPTPPKPGTTYLNTNGTTSKTESIDNKNVTTYTAHDKDGKLITMKDNEKDSPLSNKSPKDAEAIVLANAGKGPDGKSIDAVPEKDKDKRPADGATMKYQVTVGNEKRDIYVTADKDGKTMTFTDPKTGKQQTFDKTDKTDEFKADLVKFATPEVTV